MAETAGTVGAGETFIMESPNFLEDAVVLRNSPLHGVGVFARTDVKEGDVLFLDRGGDALFADRMRMDGPTNVQNGSASGPGSPRASTAAPSVGPSSASPLAQEVIEHMAEGAPPTVAVANDAKSPRVDDSIPDVFARLPDDVMDRILREARAIEVAVARMHHEPGAWWARWPCSELCGRVRQLHIDSDAMWLRWHGPTVNTSGTNSLDASPAQAAERGIADLYNGSRTAHYCGITTVARNPFIPEVRIFATDLVHRPLAYSAEGRRVRASGPPAPDRDFAARGEANAQDVMRAVNKGCRDRVACIRDAAAATAAPSVGPSSSSPLAQEVIEHMAEGAPPTVAVAKDAKSPRVDDSFPVPDVFARLPVDLMVRIVEHLPPRDIARFHCVARALQSSLLDERSIKAAMAAYRQLHLYQDSQGARTHALLRDLVTRPWNTPTLYLNGNGIGDGIGDGGLSAFAGAVASGALPQLTSLALGYNRIGDDGLSAFAGAVANGSLPQLIGLGLGGDQIGDASISALASACASRSLPQLKELYLHCNQIGDAGVSALASACASGSLPQLQTLNLAYNRIGDAGVGALARACASGSLAQVTVLFLNGNRIGDDGLSAFAGAVASGALPHLTTLALSSNSIGDPGMQSLADACARGALPQLTVLDLNSNRIGDNGLSAFAGAVASGALPQLTVLGLNSNRIGDNGLSAFAGAVASGALTKLETLYLQRNQIGDAGISALASACASGALAKLEKLFLFDNKIGDAGCTALAEACGRGSLPQLKLLHVHENQATEPGREAIKRAMTARGIKGSVNGLWNMGQ